MTHIQKDTAIVEAIRKNVNGHARPIQPSAFAPGNANPLKLATATVDAVDRIGELSADQIEQVADQVMQGAEQIAKKLRDMAEAVRHHAAVAHAKVEEYCNLNNSIYNTVADLQAKLLPPTEAQQ